MCNHHLVEWVFIYKPLLLWVLQRAVMIKCAVLHGGTHLPTSSTVINPDKGGLLMRVYHASTMSW